MDLRQKTKASRAKNLGQSDTFFIANARKAFTKLRQVFIKALILNLIDLERYIRIEINPLGYIIDRIFSQLTLNNLGQWHPLAFFFRKMIPTKTWYKIYNNELLAIVEAFKT